MAALLLLSAILACNGGGGGSTPPPVAPSISTQPANQTALEGATATFTVVASGTAPLSYQWKKGGVAIATNATSASYTTPATLLADSTSSFTVTVTNSVGSVTSSAAVLTVNPAPPAITTQPASATVTAGTMATFTVVAAGTAPLTYQWKKNGINIGSSTASYSTPATSLADNGSSFTVTVTNAQGSVTSNAAILTVQQAPAFTTQPAGTIVTAGASVTFTAAASGNPAPAYQWFRGTTSLTGQTAATLTLASATLADAGSYTVTATNSLATVTSNAAVLVVNQAPLIGTQPASQTIVSGSPVTFTVVATGFPTLSYQWKKNSVAISGQTSASYTIPAVAPADAGSYTVDVTNTAGTATSTAAVLTVTVPPAITTQPSNQTVTAPGVATFTVVATGTPTPTYQWKKNGTNIVGATSVSYVTPATSLADQAASFTVVVTNSAGTVTSSSAILTVNQAPAITTQPVSQTILAGSPVIFTVAATGFPAPTYQWNKAGIAISGQTSASYTISGVAPADAGSYTVDVTNTLGTVTSNAVVLTVTVPPAITTQPATQTVTAPAAATFTVVATGTPTPTYQWQKNLTPIPGATSASYTTSATTLADNQASYTVVVSNGVGSPVTSNAAILTVQVAPAITTQPTSQSVIVGQTATFSVAATGNPTPSYQWRKGGVAIASATNPSYNTPVTVIGDDGSTFDVVVSNGIGSPATSNTVTLSVAAAPVTPVFLTQPTSQTVVAATSVTFTSNASGTPTPTYQWKKNGTNIVGATSSSYTIPSVIPADAGTYMAVATNSQGSATSSAATLTVNYLPVITVQPVATLTVNQGSPFTLSATAVGNPSPLQYQWRKNGGIISTQSITSGTASTNTITSASSFDAGTWDVVVSNSIGSTTSNSVIVTVTPTHSVSGRVNLANGGTGVPGVTLTLNTTPTATTTVTNSNGDFSLPGVSDGTYTLTPSMAVGTNVLFLPPSQSVTVAGADLLNLQFQAAVGYTVSGTVSYPGTKTGRIYLRLDSSTGGGGALGVSISAKGAFTIRGVAPGTYTMTAWMDNLGAGNANASNPAGTRSSIVVGFGNVFGQDVTLADPAAINLAGLTPDWNGVAPMANGAFANWRSMQNAQFVEMADAYRVEWSTSSSFASVTGSANVSAMGKSETMYLGANLTNGTPYYFRYYGKAGTTTSNASAIFGPVIPAAGTGANTISGTITFTGTATGPLYVGLFDEAAGQPYAVRIPNPVSPQAFTIPGVPNGTFFFFGILDQNTNGVVDLGDLTNTEGNASSSITVTGNMTGQNLTIPSTNATASVTTNHQLYTSSGGSSENYGLQFTVDGNIKLPVNVTLQVGTALLDVGKQSQGTGYWYWVNLGSLRPTVGDTYTIQLGYSDGTTENITVAVTAVLDDFPGSLAPTTGTSTSTTPTFTWAAPSPVPSYPYTYSFWIGQSGIGGSIWQYPSNGDMPSTQLSVLYNVDNSASQTSLTPGATYSWTLSLRDVNGNSAQKTVEYKP